MRNTTKSAFWLVLFLLVGSRLLLVACADPLPGDDGNRYLREAVNLWTQGIYSDHEAISGELLLPTAHDLPLFPLLLAGLVALFEAPLLAAKIMSLLNCIFFGIAAAGVYTLGKRLTGSVAIATSSMLIFGCFPGSYPYAVFYMPESLFLAMFVGCLVKFVDFLRTQRTCTLIQAFFFWGISILAKPISVLFGPAMAIITIAMALRRRQDVARKVAAATLGLALGASVVAPWLIRNYVTFNVVGLSSITGTNPFYCNYFFMLQDMGVPHAAAVLAQQEADVIATVAPEQRTNTMVRANALGAFAKTKIIDNFGHYLVTVLKRHPKLYSSTGAVDTLRLFGDAQGVAAIEQTLADRHAWRSMPLRARVVLAGSWVLLAAGYALAALGMVRLARLRAWSTLAMLVSTLVYFAVLIGPVTSTRYRFVMLPALSIAAATGLQRKLSYFSVSEP